jgi:hypothetical protein
MWWLTNFHGSFITDLREGFLFQYPAPASPVRPVEATFLGLMVIESRDDALQKISPTHFSPTTQI